MNLSIIVCSHNKRSTIPKVIGALRSLGGNHEYILSDDNSSDGGVEWARESKLFHKVLHCGPEGGIYKLSRIRNCGVAAAINENIVIIDADCVPEETFLEGHTSILSKWNGEVISVGFTNHHDAEGKDMLNRDHRLDYKMEDGSCAIGWRDAFGGNIAFSRKVFDRVGGFDTDYDGAWGFEDFDFAFRAIKMGISLRAHVKSVARHMLHPVNSTYEGSNLNGRNNKLFYGKNGIRPC